VCVRVHVQFSEINILGESKLSKCTLQ
jgi:hypothetical protein